MKRSNFLTSFFESILIRLRKIMINYFVEKQKINLVTQLISLLIDKYLLILQRIKKRIKSLLLIR
jgi:hypothetical protein